MYYTKYRPQKFTDISKPNETAQALMSQLQKKSLGHAYLFVGPRGTGKTTTARILAKALNCKNITSEGDPCLDCESCKAIAHGNFIDLIEIDAASNRGIDDIRDLRERIKLAPSQGDSKVYIIDEVHMLTTEAFNALLKTLEEPPKHAYFILCTTELHKIPDTIKSRCQVFKFKRATKAQLLKKLQTICDSEGVSHLSSADLEKIAEASYGGFRDAETMLQQVVEGSLDPTTFVGLSSQKTYSNFVELLQTSNSKDALKSIDKIVEDGVDVHVWTSGLLAYLRDLLFLKSGVNDHVADVSDELLPIMQQQAKSLSFEGLVRYIDEFIGAADKINDSTILQLPVEVSVVKLCENIQNQTNAAPTNLNIPIPPTNNSGNSNESSNLSNIPNNLEDPDVDDYGSDIDFDEASEKTTVIDVVEVTDTPCGIEISGVTEKWSVIVKETIKINTSVHALLRSATPIDIKGNVLELEVLYEFHKERLEAPKNRKILENVLKETFKENLSINCIINSEKRPKKDFTPGAVGALTDANVSAPVFSADSPEDLGAIFDGGLPM